MLYYILNFIHIKFQLANASLETITKRSVPWMNLNLRNAVIHNVSGNTQDQLKDTIVDAIERGEEKMLPGLGVLFEVIWNNADEKEKSIMLETLEDGLKH
jgi:small acid-soluble spore protein I (minor)